MTTTGAGGFNQALLASADWHRLVLHLRLPAYVVGRCLVLWLWILAWDPVLVLDPRRGALLVAALTAAFSWWYLLRPQMARKRPRTTLRLRSPGPAVGWLVMTVPVWIVFNLSLAACYAHWAGPPPPTDARLEAYAQLPLAWLPLALIALVFAPLSEEVFFRGFIQRTLERRMGAAPGILVASVAFALFHGNPWRFGYLCAGGIVFGAFVFAARSIWAGIALHVAANASGALLDAFGIGVDALVPRDPSISPLAAEFLLLSGSLLLLVALFGRVRQSARGRRGVPRPAARPHRTGSEMEIRRIPTVRRPR